MLPNIVAVSSKALGPKDLLLTCKGMSLVNWGCSDSDFEFVFSEDKSCRVHSVLAEFLSPKVARVRKCDPLCSFYAFKDSELFTVFESLVSSLRSGAALRVENSNFAAILRLSQELENAELLSLLLGMIDPESLDLELAILLLRDGSDLGSAFCGQFGSLRDFIASRFYELEKEILDALDLETDQILLSSPSLKVQDEDSRYDFVRSRCENDLRFASLFEFIYFDYLSVDRIENFASFVSENFLENINFSIWSQICRRLILETKPKEENPHKCRNNATGKKATAKESGRKFVYDGSNRLNGVIAHLTRECGGNVHDKGVVNVTASSFGIGSPEDVVDLDADPEFYSKDKQNSWICYDFKERRVIPTSYSVKSHICTPGGCQPKSWVIEVSNDGMAWTKIDRRDNNNDLNDGLVTVNFNISRVPNEGFRFFRLRLTGENHVNNHQLALSSLEIFGTLIEK